MTKTKFFITLMGAVGAVRLLIGGPLVQSEIAKEALWLGHVDMEAITSSSIGEMGLSKIKDVIAENKGSRIGFDLDLVLSEIKSITAYGSSFEEEAETKSVLMLKCGDRLQSILDGYAASQEVSEEGTVFQRLEGHPHPTFLLEDELYVSFPSKGHAIAGKSFAEIEKALSVVRGTSPSLEDADEAFGLNGRRNLFLTVGVRNLDTLKEVPAKARMFQKATGGQVALGEDDGLIKASLILNTPDPKVSSQLARIIQGMLALVSFAEIDDRNVLMLTQSAKVLEGKRHVAVDLEYPVSELLGLVESLVKDSAAKRDEKRGDRNGLDQRYLVQVDDETGGDLLSVRNVDASDDHNGNLPFFAIDGDFDTDWVTNGRRHWIRFLLDSPSLVKELQISYRKGDVWRSRFAVQASDDGKVWRDIVFRESSGETTELESFNIPDTETRWIRIRCFGNHQSGTNAITEVRWLGDANFNGEDEE